MLNMYKIYGIATKSIQLQSSEYYLLHCVLRKPVILQQPIENRLANLRLLRRRSSSEFVETYIEPFIHLLMNRMISTKSTAISSIA